MERPLQSWYIFNRIYFLFLFFEALCIQTQFLKSAGRIKNDRFHLCLQEPQYLAKIFAPVTCVDNSYCGEHGTDCASAGTSPHPPFPTPRPQEQTAGESRWRRLIHLTSKNQISSSPYWERTAAESPLLIFQFQSFPNLFERFATTKPSGPWRGMSVCHAQGPSLPRTCVCVFASCLTERRDGVEDMCFYVFERAGLYYVSIFISVTNHSGRTLSVSGLYVNTLRGLHRDIAVANMS